MINEFSIKQLRDELGWSCHQMAHELGLKSPGNVSMMERGAPITGRVALIYESLSIKNGTARIDAAALNADVAAARAGCECHHDAQADAAPVPAQGAKSVNAGAAIDQDMGAAA